MKDHVGEEPLGVNYAPVCRQEFCLHGKHRLYGTEMPIVVTINAKAAILCAAFNQIVRKAKHHWSFADVGRKATIESQLDPDEFYQGCFENLLCFEFVHCPGPAL